MKTAVRFYKRHLSKYTPSCGMTPVCSSYGLNALSLHGNWWGTGMMVYRVFSCNPWNKTKDDPCSHTLGREEKRRAFYGWAVILGWVALMACLVIW
jgi:putative membrane protein insertion efficiency factor